MAEDTAVLFLRGVLNRLRSQPWERERFDAPRARAAREDALSRYATMLSPELVRETDRDALLELLRDVNKHHKMGHGRGVPRTADLGHLREALAILVDENLSLEERLNRLRPPGGAPLVKGFGPSVITSILHLIDPSRYGVLTGTSESVLRRLGVYPTLPGSASLAARYEAVNNVLLRLAASLGIDLGLLDYLFWRVQPQALADYAQAQRPHRVS